MLMRANPTKDGGVCVWANQAFQDKVCPVEELHTGWKVTPQDAENVWRTFTHPDDWSVIPTAFGRLLSTHFVGGEPPRGKCSQTTALVRIGIGSAESGRAFTPCYAEMHLVYVGEQAWLGIFFNPILSDSTTLGFSGQSSHAVGAPAMRELEGKIEPPDAALPDAKRPSSSGGELAKMEAAVGVISTGTCGAEEPHEAKQSQEQPPSIAELSAADLDAGLAGPPPSIATLPASTHAPNDAGLPPLLSGPYPMRPAPALTSMLGSQPVPERLPMPVGAAGELAGLELGEIGDFESLLTSTDWLGVG